MGLNEFYRFYEKDLFRFYTQYSNIPPFHYSMIAAVTLIQVNVIYSASCINSNTLGYSYVSKF